MSTSMVARLVSLVLALACLLGGSLPAEAAYTAPNPAAEAAKFNRANNLATKLNAVDKKIDAQLANPQADRATAVAAVARIMELTHMRVGSRRYAMREEKDVTLRSGRVIHQGPTYGASSLLKKHVEVHGDTIRFHFPGKSYSISGKAWDRTVTDPALANALRIFLKEPGEELFPINESHVRPLFAAYGAKVKDLRTLQANQALDEQLAKLPRPRDRKTAEHNLTIAIDQVAKSMGHTPAVCRSNYLNPKKLTAYTAGLN